MFAISSIRRAGNSPEVYEVLIYGSIFAASPELIVSESMGRPSNSIVSDFTHYPAYRIRAVRTPGNDWIYVLRCGITGTKISNSSERYSGHSAAVSAAMLKLIENTSGDKHPFHFTLRKYTSEEKKRYRMYLAATDASLQMQDEPENNYLGKASLKQSSSIRPKFGSGPLYMLEAHLIDNKWNAEVYCGATGCKLYNSPGLFENENIALNHAFEVLVKTVRSSLNTWLTFNTNYNLSND